MRGKVLLLEAFHGSDSKGIMIGEEIFLQKQI